MVENDSVASRVGNQRKGPCSAEKRIGQGERVENIRKREDKSVFGGFAVFAKLLNSYSEWRSG